jgi:arginase family enzyme
VRSVGIEVVVEQTLEIFGEGPVFLWIDVDVLDPAFAPGTGTPEPGGLTSSELLWATRTVAVGLDIVGADVVEVIPTTVGSADITALVAERTVREVMTGIALRRR